MTENVHYKHEDYAIRANDPYALAKYKIIMRWLPQKSDLRVLNAGCGSGEMSVLLAQNESWTIDAIDVDPDAIQRSMELKHASGLSNLAISQSSIEDHPGRDYDIVISNDVLEHIEDDKQAISCIVSMIKPGGMFCISVPALQWLYGYHDELLGHYRRYNKRLLQSRLSPFFSVKTCRYFGAGMIPIAVLYSHLLRRSYPVGKQSPGSLPARALEAILGIEQKVAFPMGTSLLALAVAPI
jgi:SAM-dependent methyltransferase